MHVSHPIQKSKIDLQFYGRRSKGIPNIRSKNVLIYWPHGFGDFVFLSVILPFLDPSNRYFIVRFGDNNSTIFDGCELITPMYVGIDSCHCGDGALIGMQHFGDRHLDSDGSVKTVEIPHSLYVGCRANNIEVLIDIPFGESHGGEPFPFHTKARKMLKRLVSEERLNSFRLNRPLPSTINFSVSPNVQQWVDARLRNGLGLDATKHLCVITRSGYTSVYKNWGHRWREEMPLGKRFEGEECRDFVKLLKAKNERWRILVMEDRLFDGNDSVSDFSIGCLSYAQLFDGDLGGPLPFAWILKAVLKRAELVVGVPSGPTHLALAMPHLPVVGIWFTAIPQADKKMGWLGVVTQPLSWG